MSALAIISFLLFCGTPYAQVPHHIVTSITGEAISALAPELTPMTDGFLMDLNVAISFDELALLGLDAANVTIASGSTAPIIIELHEGLGGIYIELPLLDLTVNPVSIWALVACEGTVNMAMTDYNVKLVMVPTVTDDCSMTFDLPSEYLSVTTGQTDFEVDLHGGLCRLVEPIIDLFEGLILTTILDKLPEMIERKMEKSLMNGIRNGRFINIANYTTLEVCMKQFDIADGKIVVGIDLSFPYGVPEPEEQAMTAEIVDAPESNMTLVWIIVVWCITFLMCGCCCAWCKLKYQCGSRKYQKA